VAWKDRIHVSESSPKFFMCCSWSFIVLNNICTGQIKHLWNHIKLLIDYVYTLHHLFNKEKGNPSISINFKEKYFEKRGFENLKVKPKVYIYAIFFQFLLIFFHSPCRKKKRRLLRDWRKVTRIWSQ
jgi:hypothetical protein